MQIDLLRQWRQLVNMTHAEVQAWRNNPRHKLASGKAGWASLAAIERMLRTPPQQWTTADWDHARRVCNFNARHLASHALFGAEVGQSGWSRRAIALRNWGHDPSKPNSPARASDAEWLRNHAGARERRR